VAILEILTDGDPILREKSIEVKEITNEVLSYVKDMKETIKKSNGVGLAAPQVGILERVVLVCFQITKKKYSSPIVLINPKILSFSDDKNVDEEGCLSIPGVYDNVSRYTRIEVEYMDLDGKVHVEEFQDFNARVIQHEVDHLNGILFVDRV